MGASCCLTGDTEVATLKKELEWTAGWARKLLSVLKSTHRSIYSIINMHSVGSIDDLDPQTTLDAMTTIAQGAVKVGEQAFELGRYRDPDSNELCLHQALERDLDKMILQGKGNVPVPFNRNPIEISSKEPVPGEDVMFFKDSIQRILDERRMAQTILSKAYGGDKARCKALLKMTLEIVDPQTGRALKLKEMDLNEHIAHLISTLGPNVAMDAYTPEPPPPPAEAK